MPTSPSHPPPRTLERALVEGNDREPCGLRFERHDREPLIIAVRRLDAWHADQLGRAELLADTLRRNPAQKADPVLDEPRLCPALLDERTIADNPQLKSCPDLARIRQAVRR